MWAISLFAPYKAAGLDGIFPTLMHLGLEIITEPLIRIFRACIALGYVPTAWLTSRVPFVPKPGQSDYFQAKAFRPISLTSFLLKTLERLIDRYIRDSVLLVHPLQKNQHAYQPGKSTETALHSLVTRIERTLERQEYALAVFLDIEGAFDNASV